MELTHNVRKWLAANGYPLEMKAAKVFKTAGFDVEQSEYYLDRDTEDYRELDILASLSRDSKRVHYSLRALVECKFCKSNPWLLLTDSGETKRQVKLIMHP